MPKNEAKRWFAGLVIAGALAGPAGSATITVDNTADLAANDGACTLREAIWSANEDAASGSASGECAAGDRVFDVIKFAIPGTGPFFFDLLTPLPLIRESVFIDGYSQPGARPNKALVGNDARIMLEVRGDAMAPDCDRSGDSPLSGAAFQFVNADASSRLRGFAITGFSAHDAAVFVFRAGNVRIDGNFIGFDTSGAPRPNGKFGVVVANGAYTRFLAVRNGEPQYETGDDRGRGNIVGGSTPAERNVIAGNEVAVVLGGRGNRVENNYIDVDPQGMTPAPGLLALQVGQLALQACDLHFYNYWFTAGENLIGGHSRATGNLIVTGTACAVELQGSGNSLHHNLIGTDRDGVSGAGGGGLGNFRGCGVSLGPDATNNTIEGNVIAFNTTGILAKSAGGSSLVGNDIKANSIHWNSGLGIDLEDDAVSANDGDDSDTGANGLQNFPEKLFATTAGVRGEVRGKPDQLQRIDFFQNATCDPSGNGEGDSFVGSTSVITDPSGFAAFSFSARHPLSLERFVTATATSADGTSEFSSCTTVVPASGAQVQVSSSLNPAGSQETYRITVTVRGTGGVAPQGTVKLFDMATMLPGAGPGGGFGFHTLGAQFLTPVGPDTSEAVIDSNKIQLPGRGWGNVRIVADYGGDAHYAPARTPELVQGIYREKSDFDRDGFTDLLLCDEMNGTKHLLPGTQPFGAPVAVPVRWLDAGWTVLATGNFGTSGPSPSPGVLWSDSGRLGGTLFGANMPWGNFEVRLPAGLTFEAIGSLWGGLYDDFIARDTAGHQFALLSRAFVYDVLELYPHTELINRTTGAVVSPTGTYDVEHVGDFDGDGNLDWIFRNAMPSSEHVIWRLDGTLHRLSEQALATPRMGSSIVATGDFDGDGRTDYVWAHANPSDDFLLAMQAGVGMQTTLTIPKARVSEVLATAFYDAGAGTSGGRSSLIVKTPGGALEAWINTGVVSGVPQFDPKPLPLVPVRLAPCVP